MKQIAAAATELPLLHAAAPGDRHAQEQRMTQNPFRLTRRSVLEAGTAVAALSLLAEPPHAAAAPAPTPMAAADVVPVELRINGRVHALTLDPRTTLLDALRERLGLTGTKKGCDQGQCGACTVIVNGQRINSCLALAAMHDGDSVVTIEGLADADALHPMQAAFVRHDALQCGYCTPGQICSAVAVVAEHRAGWPSWATADVSTAPELTRAEIAERMSGNICRCSAYSNIVTAIREVAVGGRA
jgi:xanthine dehydrogenase YagT iron-sulfur-binding subunit